MTQEQEISQAAAQAILAALRSADDALDVALRRAALGWPEGFNEAADGARKSIRAAIALAERGA